METSIQRRNHSRISNLHLSHHIGEEIYGEAKVISCFLEGLMSHIGFENREICRQILSLFGPFFQAVSSISMAKVVDARAASFSTMRNSSAPEKFSEVFIYIRNGHWLVIQSREKILFRNWIRMYFF